MTFRIDAAGRLDKAERIDGGGYRVPAAFTRVGVLEYRQPNGSIRRELRPPEEAFSDAALASYKSAPVTLGHPPQGLLKTPSDRSKHAVGHIEGQARVDGEFSAGEIVVWREDALSAIEGRTHDRGSVGVNIRLDETPGIWNGRPYDAVQRDITINHFALVTRERATGSALRLDSGDAISVEFEGTNMSQENKEIVKIRLDGVDVVYGSAEHIKHFETALSTAKQGTDKAQARADSLEKELKEATSQARIDALVNARGELVATAREHCGPEFRTDGVSDRDIKIAVIQSVDKDFRADGKSDDYVSARYDIAREAKAKTEPVKDATRLDAAALKDGAKRLDSVNDAKSKYQTHYANAWKNISPQGSES
jgi:hypothetical protein